MTKPILYATVVAIALWMIAPMLVVIVTSFTDTPSFNFPPSGYSLRWYENFFANQAWRASFINTTLVAALVTITATTIGTLAAIGLHKGRFFGKSAMTGLMLAPLIVPGILVAIGLYSVFIQLNMLGSLPGFVIAHTVVALPLVIINVMTALSTFDSRLEQAASSLGAGRWEIFRRITMPLIMPGVLAGAVFAFITSFDEIIISLFIQSPRLQTLPVRMFQSVTQDTDPTVAAVAVLMMLVSVGLAALTRLIKPRSGSKQ
ncbi:ABC transporter permease [Shinella granuli]|uniref:Putative spermidine/putrescine transport system permease protein n=1 Tax=Shinella granuli TaxID=323621 RepID=A0A4R2C411_SHIGR|nr:ABC transporter permease [Shinella granuli]TCN34342.1 putative spermidine/putrescine transport system permease protein [Shinella granuli]